MGAETKTVSTGTKLGPETYLEVHVAIRADQEALVLKPPLEPDIHELARELLHERLGVNGVDLTVQRRRSAGCSGRDSAHARQTWSWAKGRTGARARVGSAPCLDASTVSASLSLSRLGRY
jgi:hypothetical protein